jgi:hypothetical protein
MAAQWAALDTWSSAFGPSRSLPARLAIPAVIALVVVAALVFTAVSQGLPAVLPFLLAGIAGVVATSYGKQQPQQRRPRLPGRSSNNG